jgi:hypothetical protein
MYRKPRFLQPQDQAHVECRGAHAKDQRQAEQQLKRDGRTNELSQVAGNDRKFTSDPQAYCHWAVEALAAELRQVTTRGDPQAQGQGLQKNRQQVCNGDDREQRIAVSRSAG